MKINEECQLIVNQNSKKNQDIIIPQSEKEKNVYNKKLKNAFIFVLFFLLILIFFLIYFILKIKYFLLSFFI